MDTLKICMRLFWKCSDIFRKNYMKLNLVIFPSMFWIDGTYIVYSTPPTPLGWYSSNLVQLLWTLWWCACDFLEDYRHYLRNLHVVELSHFSSMFWINCIFRYQLITYTIINVLEQPGPFYSWIDFLKEEYKLDLSIEISNLLTFQLWWSSQKTFSPAYIPYVIMGSKPQKRHQYDKKKIVH
jgi:hypothetical protein